MDISARAISLTDRPQRAIWVTSVRTRREDRTSISSHPLADLGWKLLIGLCHRFLLISRSSFVRSKGRSFVPARRASSRSDACIVGPRQFEGASFSQPAQAMRASLLASAIASTLWCNRLLAASIQD